jgi:hypothetical protein
MSTLMERVQADLDALNALARECLDPATLPDVGSWVRCWDTRQEAPLGLWHLVTDLEAGGEVAYLCGQLGIVTILSAFRAPTRFAIQTRRDPPDVDACWRCLRDP